MQSLRVILAVEERMCSLSKLYYRSKQRCAALASNIIGLRDGVQSQQVLLSAYDRVCSLSELYYQSKRDFAVLVSYIISI